jgi:G3E family GTPase
LFATAGRSEAARRWFAAEVTPRDDETVHDRNRHDETIHAFALSFDGPLDWTLFGLWLTMLLNRHGEKLLRVKGILNVAGSSAPVAVHGVQHLVHPPVHMTAWPDADRRSRLVFIVDGLDRGLIERSLKAFLRQDAGNGERVLNQTALA